MLKRGRERRIESETGKERERERYLNKGRVSEKKRENWTLCEEKERHDREGKRQEREQKKWEGGFPLSKNEHIKPDKCNNTLTIEILHTTLLRTLLQLTVITYYITHSWHYLPYSIFCY